MARTAFIGLGVMGYPMAGHLAKAGHEVTVYNRTAEKAENWAKEHGGKTAKTPAEAAKGAEIVFCCVGNDDDLRSVTTGAEGAFSEMGGGALFVDHTTASAQVARELDKISKKGGFRLCGRAGFRRSGRGGKWRAHHYVRRRRGGL